MGVGFVGSLCTDHPHRDARKRRDGRRRCRARVHRVQRLAGTLHERLPGGIRRHDTVISNRLIGRELTRLDDDDRATWVRVPAGVAALKDDVLLDNDVQTLRDGNGSGGLVGPTTQNRRPEVASRCSRRRDRAEGNDQAGKPEGRQYKPNASSGWQLPVIRSAPPRSWLATTKRTRPSCSIRASLPLSLVRMPVGDGTRIRWVCHRSPCGSVKAAQANPSGCAGPGPANGSPTTYPPTCSWNLYAAQSLNLTSSPSSATWATPILL
jgi:hypothetical protein